MIQTSDSSRIYIGNNSSTTPYPVPFYFQNDEDLFVVFQYTTGEYTAILGTDYTVTGKGNPNGGSIKTLWPVDITAKVSIARIVPMTQLTSYEEGDSFPAKSHEAALDKLTLEIQQVARGTGTGTGGSEDIGSAFRVTQASGGIKSLVKVADSMVGLDSSGEAILRTPSDLLGWLGQVGTAWRDSAQRAVTRGAFAGQTGVQTDNWTIYVARSTNPGDWVPHLKESGVVISTNGTPTAKPNPNGDIVGTTHAQTLTNKTLNGCAFNGASGLVPGDVGLGNCDNTSDANKPVSDATLIALQAKQDLALKGQPNGYPDLDATGKVPTSQLPGGGGGGGTLYKGSWNALTNTPSITTGSANAGNIGWFYIVSVAGTTNVDGIASWAVSDQIVSNGTIWQKIVASGSGVTSVNSRTGVVTLTKADVGLTNVDNTSDVSKNSAVGTLTNKTIDGAANTLNVRLNTSDVSGNLPVSRLNAGTGAGPNTWWCGDNTWKQPNGTGDVTGVGSSVVGESVVMSDTNGKRVAGYSGPQGFAIITPGNATTAIPYIDVGHLDPQLIHGLPEKVAVVDLDEILIWDSSTGTFMKVKKQNLGVPPGSIIDFGGTTAPNGYLLCDGKSYLRTDYAGLFSAIGVQWGSVDSTHFTVPDFRGFVAAGKDDMGGTNANRLSTLGAAATTIGGAGGAQTHTLTLAQLAQHRHLGADHTHSNNSWNAYQTMADGGGHRCVYWDTYQNINTGAADRALYTDYQGSNGAHNNIQPTRMVLKIIKY